MSDGMQELIARLEAATGPSRELDAEIWCAANSKKFLRFDGMAMTRGNVFFHERDDGTAKIECSHPRYSSSLDAALTLVPEGCEGEIFWHYGSGQKLGYAEVKIPNPLWDTPDCPPEEENRYAGLYYSYKDDADRHTDAAKPLPICIAVSIAALKARGIP